MPPTLMRVAIALACALGAGYLAAEAVDAERVQRANELGIAGDYEGALSAAARVQGGPAERRAMQVEANALYAAGRLEQAADAFARLARRDPHNWVVHSEHARVLLALGARRRARAAMARARRLNPTLPLPSELAR